MKIVKLPCHHAQSLTYRGEIMDYLLTLGLVRSVEFELYYFTGTQEMHITLNDGYESFSSLILMKFI